ncbi:MAG TPA: MFS transporter, partial [Myxococcota bacterium]|nr:MFS transporter [Myxococcota bacterium]
VSSTVFFALASVVYAVAPDDDVHRLRAPWFWALVVLVMAGSVVGNLRSIALSTCVTLLVPEGERDRANGMIGATMGVSFTITSVFSGLAIGQLGMGWALALSTVVSVAGLGHLLTIAVPEDRPAPAGAQRSPERGSQAKPGPRSSSAPTASSTPPATSRASSGSRQPTTPTGWCWWRSRAPGARTPGAALWRRRRSPGSSRRCAEAGVRGTSLPVRPDPRDGVMTPRCAKTSDSPRHAAVHPKSATLAPDSCT